jgi:GNAT superfamily N-acetyltransferase
MRASRGSGGKQTRGSRSPRSSARGRLRLRVASARDLPTLVRHRRRMWEELRDYSVADLDRHDLVYARWVRAQTSRGKFVGLIVETPRGEVAGSGGLWLMPQQPRPGALGRGEIPYILSMYTEPGFRGRGVATRIVREMIRWSRARRYGRVLLHASRFGRPIYERLGFEAGSEMRLELIPQPKAAQAPGLRT